MLNELLSIKIVVNDITSMPIIECNFSVIEYVGKLTPNLDIK